MGIAEEGGRAPVFFQCDTLVDMRVRFLFLLLPGLLAAQSLQDFEKKVTEFTLPNGMHFLVIERHEAPVVSFHTYANVGSVDDPSGETGIAHMFEHMAFKGTPTIGTKNWPEEKKALDAIEAGLRPAGAEKNKAFRADPKKIEAIKDELKAAIAKANSFVEENEFDRIVESNGGVGMNAGTAEDSTELFLQLPVQRHRTVVSARIRALPASGVPRVLQRARRGARRAAHARRIEPAGQAGGGAAGHRLRGASL